MPHPPKPCKNCGQVHSGRLCYTHGASPQKSTAAGKDRQRSGDGPPKDSPRGLGPAASAGTQVPPVDAISDGVALQSTSHPVGSGSGIGRGHRIKKSSLEAVEIELPDALVPEPKGKGGRPPAGFDKVEYMREYQRKRRAKLKAENEGNTK